MIGRPRSTHRIPPCSRCDPLSESHGRQTGDRPMARRSRRRVRRRPRSTSRRPAVESRRTTGGRARTAHPRRAGVLDRRGALRPGPEDLPTATRPQTELLDIVRHIPAEITNREYGMNTAERDRFVDKGHRHSGSFFRAVGATTWAPQPDTTITNQNLQRRLWRGDRPHSTPQLDGNECRDTETPHPEPKSPTPSYPLPLSRLRYWIASLTCAGAIPLALARSAMVRAILRIR